jgi:hypothetical protein
LPPLSNPQGVKLFTTKHPAPGREGFQKQGYCEGRVFRQPSSTNLLLVASGLSWVLGGASRIGVGRIGLNIQPFITRFSRFSGSQSCILVHRMRS